MNARPLTAALAAALLLLAGCGSDTEDSAAPEPSNTEHNSADVTFATDMLPHHAQALSMVDLTLGRKLDPEVADLAEQIRNTQVPETETMVDWLTEWGEPVPETSRDHVNADSHDGMETDSDMPGMMSGEEMQALEDASDAEFEQLFLAMMIEHHEGAIEMAKTEQEQGVFGPAVELAESIATSQDTEITTMKGLLGS
jgi:uncharacterized protein (DUF305 family)